MKESQAQDLLDLARAPLLPTLSQEPGDVLYKHHHIH